MIFLGEVLGEPEQNGSPIDKAISTAMRAAVKLRLPFEIGESPAVNTVFYVPGRMIRPDWDGLRDGKFSRKQQFLMIQVAVPEAILASTHIHDFIITSLHAANKLAFQVFHKKGMEFSLSEADALVDRIERAIGAA